MVVTGIDNFNVDMGTPEEELRVGKFGRFPVIKITTDADITGYSFGFGYSPKKVQMAREMLIGKDPFAIEDFLDQGISKNRLGGWEHALWDVIGKACGLPVYRLLGGPYRDRVKLYLTIVWPSKDGSFQYLDNQSNVPFEKQAEDIFFFKKHGFLGVKIRCWRPNIMDDVEALKHIKRAVGDDFTVMFDRTSHYPGWIWTYEQAYQVARGLEENGAYWLEDPFEWADEACIAKSARLCDAVDLLISGGHGVDELSKLAKFFSNDAFDVYNPETGDNGILFCQKVGMMAQAFKKQMITHGWHGLRLAGYLQVDAASPLTSWQEIGHVNPNLLPQDAWEPGLKLLHNKDVFHVENGYMSIPQGPGLGLDVNEDALAEYRV